jgi:hypothetical protein
MKKNQNYMAWYIGASLVWCIFLVLFSLSSQAIERETGIFIIGAAFVLLAAIFAPYPKGSGDWIAIAIIASLILVVPHPIFRFLASLFFDLLKAKEENFQIALRPAGAPENFPIINGSLILFTALGLLHITVSFLYWLKVIRKRPKTPNHYPWLFCFKSFFSLTRLLFLCIPLLLIVVITYVHEVCGYRGVGSHGWGIIVIFTSYLFLYPFKPRKERGVYAIVSLLSLTLFFISVKNYEHMLFSMRSSLDITSESLVAYEELKEIIFLPEYMKMFAVPPKIRTTG